MNEQQIHAAALIAKQVLASKPEIVKNSALVANGLISASDLIRQLRAENDRLGQSETEVMTERDHWLECAEKLAAIVAKDNDLHIGEHSNCNCPIQNAINLESEDLP